MDAPAHATRDPAIWAETPYGAVITDEVRALSGLDQLRAIRARPALYHLTGTTFDGAAPGEATFSMPITGWLRASQGLVPGGMLAVVADGALGCAVHTELRAGQSYTTAQLSMTFLRPVTVGTRVTAAGRALHVGRTLALSDCEVRDETGALIAHGTSRCIVFGGSGSPSRGGTALGAPAAPEPPAGAVDPFEREPAGSVLGADVWDSLSGQVVLERQVEGRLPAPPLHHLLGIAPVAAGEGQAECVMPLTGWLATPWGWPQGGFLAAMADCALGMAVQTTVPAGTGFAGVDIAVNYIRGVAADGSLLRAHARVLHRGRSLAVATVEIVDARGRLVVLATGSAQILEGEAAARTRARA